MENSLKRLSVISGLLKIFVVLLRFFKFFLGDDVFDDFRSLLDEEALVLANVQVGLDCVYDY